MYAQFLDKAVIDGRVRTVSNILNPDKSVSSVIPRFWEYAGINNHYTKLKHFINEY